MEYTDKEYWDNYWENEARGMLLLLFRFVRSIYPVGENELLYGSRGAPGSIMAYMHNEHGLRGATVDFTE